ncbi:CDP-alcohol phosphatidyltransferase family protein [Acetobacterium wieringae]|uniref:CDP-alcohol phosphatidyltransferase family protein n=1 Tax=Acetobacterium wieringae TaxID=52694 RepID=UPI0026EAC564|nr:CDP-alcohol phosphatidyltransferase family protein [Acetobacterium wieringae]
MKKEYLPNIITTFRIFLSLCLLFIDFRSAVFIFGYLICGFTDLLDGYIARKIHSETLLGAKLDSIADLFMSGMIIITVIKQNQINQLIFLGIIIITILRTGNAVLTKIKFKQIAIIHTSLNKVSGLFFFFCPIVYPFWDNRLLIITGFLAFFAAIEEFLIILTSKTLNLNRTSIFFRE